MRLTLRTMLAYLDDILEPADAAEIGKKIEDSEFATDLVNKTRDVMRRLRLGAPQPVGKGMGLDPNTVAEYLDNTMPPEQVADFERVCLESDMHLAEASACHQVLTLVLGEPAEVIPASRERMYKIPALAERVLKDRADAAHVKPTAPPVESASAIASATARRAKPEVPEYLREARRSRWKAGVGVFVLAACLGGLVMALATERDWWDGEAPPTVAEGESPVEPEDLSPLEAPATIAPPRLDDPGSIEPAPPLLAPIDPTTDANPITADPATVPGLTQPEEGLPATDEPLPNEPAVNESEPILPDANAPPLTADVDAVGPRPGLTVPDARPAVIGEPAFPPEPAMPADPADSALATDPAAVTDPPLAATDPLGAPPAEPAVAGESAARVGIYVFDKNVLLRRDPTSGEWKRLHLPVPLAAGDRLLSLPTFRNTINLTTGLTLQLVGGTSVVLGPVDEDGVPELELLYGRIVLMSVGREDTRVRLKLGEQVPSVGFGGVGSVLAVDLHRTQVSGVDPEVGPAPVEVDLYVSSGHVNWQLAEQLVTVNAPATWRLSVGPPAPGAPVETLPEWITSEPLSVIDQQASRTLEESLIPDRPLTLSLAELVNGRRLEVRALAARSSVYLGQFEPFVVALNDADQHARWNGHIDTLRESLALGPSVAGGVKEAFVRRRGEDGPALYRMLWGYSPEDLAAGAGEQLVKDLDHDSLDYRVLAFWNLKTITGYGLNYRPEYPAARRLQSVRRWQERLAAGEVVYPAPGTPRAVDE